MHIMDKIPKEKCTLKTHKHCRQGNSKTRNHIVDKMSQEPINILWLRSHKHNYGQHSSKIHKHIVDKITQGPNTYCSQDNSRNHKHIVDKIKNP